MGGCHRAPREPAEWGWLNRVCASFLTFLFCFSLCIFCGERSDSFTEEGLDLHYWKQCLMLTRCDYCKQVRRWARAGQAQAGELDAQFPKAESQKCPKS